MALLDPSTPSSDSALAATPAAVALHDSPKPAIGGGQLWNRFKGGFWTLLDQGLISLGTFLLNVQLARHLDAPEYGTFALLLGCYFMVQHVNAAFIYYPLMMKLAGGELSRPSDLVFVSLILTALVTGVSSVGVTLFLVAFGRSDIAIAAGIYLAVWQLQDVLRRALLAQFSHQMAAIADGITYIGASIGIAILAASGNFTLSNALFAMAGSCVLAIAIQVMQRPPTFPHTSSSGRLLQGFWTHGKWAFVNGVILIVTVQAFPWTLVLMDGPGAAADFQAVLNIANLANPIAFGLSNIITPAVAQAHASGTIRQAWRAAWTYIVIGAALLSFFAVPVMLMPETVLALFYGANSPFVHLEQAVCLMVLAVAINSIADMMSQFIFAVGSSKAALWMNGISLGVVVLLLPSVGVDGVAACALVLGAAKVVRLIAASRIIARMLSSKPPSGHSEGAKSERRQ